MYVLVNGQIVWQGSERGQIIGEDTSHTDYVIGRGASHPEPITIGRGTADSRSPTPAATTRVEPTQPGGATQARPTDLSRGITRQQGVEADISSGIRGAADIAQRALQAVPTENSVMREARIAAEALRERLGLPPRSEMIEVRRSSTPILVTGPRAGGGPPLVTGQGTPGAISVTLVPTSSTPPTERQLMMRELDRLEAIASGRFSMDQTGSDWATVGSGVAAGAAAGAAFGPWGALIGAAIGGIGGGISAALT